MRDTIWELKSLCFRFVHCCGSGVSGATIEGWRRTEVLQVDDLRQVDMYCAFLRADDGTAMYSSLYHQVNQCMLYNAEDGEWVQLQCPFFAAVQCAIVDSDGLANIHAVSQNARIAPKDPVGT